MAEIQQLGAYLSYDVIAVRKDLGDPVSFMIASGARIGEVCALSWADVDLDTGTVATRGTVLRIKGKGTRHQPTEDEGGGADA